MTDAQFIELFSSTYDGACRYATKLTMDPDVAEDIAMEAYARAWRSRASYRGEGTEGAWIRSIVHNVAVTHIRRKRDVTFAPLESGEWLVDTSASPEEAAVASELTRALAEACRGMSESQQRVLAMRLRGQSHDGIAAQLGQRVGSIRALQFRAMERLRVVLAVRETAGETP